MAKRKLSKDLGDKINNGSFDLNAFKKSKYSNFSSKFKEQKWIPLSPAFQKEVGIPGIPEGHITLLRGHSDTGKTTALIEAAVSAQKNNVLPVFIITEMKWNWEHAIEMGLKVNPIVDEDTGEVLDYDGFFLFTDRTNIVTVEDVAEFISDLLKEQYEGNLPYNLCFLWDSVGSLTCEQSLKSNKNNNEWIAGAMSTQFSNGLNQKILMSRKEQFPYTNTLVCVNKVWVQKAATPMSQPKMMNKAGNAMFYDASLVVTFGNVTTSGTSKLKAIKNGKQVEYAKRTKIHIEKNHVTNVTARGSLIMTPFGFIEDDKKVIDEYKKQHNDEWASLLGGSDFKLIEEEDDGEIEYSDNSDVNE